MTTTKNISLEGIDPGALYGAQNRYLRLIEEHFRARITGRGQNLIIEGEEAEAERIDSLFQSLIRMINQGNRLSLDDVRLALEMLDKDSRRLAEDLQIVANTPRAVVKPRTMGQHVYVRSLEKNDVLFAIGPAGTGKTFLAVAMAVNALLASSIDRIILTRPAIEAGENLGFLPGDLQEKVEPYLRPLYDCLFDLLPHDKVHHYISGKVIEVIPLGYMRGRTLNNAFIILDEAQNTTPLQMKMFLTRLGTNAKAIITGDITQVDLKEPEGSGLIQVRDVLDRVSRVKFIYLDKNDIVRAKLVKDIVQAYEKHEDAES